MFPGDFSMGSWWIIFPIFGLIVMVTFMVMMITRMGFMGPRRDWSSKSQDRDESETALDILKKRYAKGEINKEEFDEMKKDL